MKKHLDYLIAEHIFGWTWYSKDEIKEMGFDAWYDHTCDSCNAPKLLVFWNKETLTRWAKDQNGYAQLQTFIPNYSESISSAWDVVEKLQENQPASEFDLYQDYDGLWRCRFKGYTPEYMAEVFNIDTAPRAICLAALKTKGIIKVDGH